MKKEERIKPASAKDSGFIFKLAGISGISYLVFIVLGVFISQYLQAYQSVVVIWSVIQGIMITLFSAVFIYGLYALGKKYGNKFLRVVCISLIFVIIFSYLINISVFSTELINAITQAQKVVAENAMNLGLDISNINALSEDQAQLLISQVLPQVLPLFKNILIMLAIYILVMFTLSILLGIGLIKLKDKVKYAKTAGILEIVGAVLAIVLIGFLVMFVAFIFEIVLLLKEARK